MPEAGPTSQWLRPAEIHRRRGRPRRRGASGEHQNVGGGARKRRTEGQTLRGEHQKNDTSPAVPFLHLAGADLAGDDAGDELGGGQGSGVIEVIDTEGVAHGT